MPNDFYTPTGNPTDNSNIVSADMRAEFAAINAGFNKLPTLTGNANKLVVINSSGTGLDVTTAPTGLTSINKVAITQPANGATLTILDGKTLTTNHSLTLAGTDGTVMTFPATSATIARTDAANTFVGVQDFNGRIDANAGLAVTGGNTTTRGFSDTATAVALSLSGSGANSITIANSASAPVIGTSAGNLALTPATGLVTLNGTGNANLYINAATANSSLLLFSVNNAEVARITSDGSEDMFFSTGSGASAQVQINHTAAADRYITLTGSFGGNPTIGTSAGNLAITPQLNLTSNLYVGFSTAIGAGGVGNPVIAMSAASIYICCGSGAPGISAAKGSLYLRSDGSTTNNRMYVNADGGTTWTAITTAA